MNQRDEVESIIEKHWQCRPLHIERMPTGLCHYVYKVVIHPNQTVIVRIASPANRHYLEGSAFWIGQLSGLEVPIPKIHALELEGMTPYMIYDYIAGDDLGNIYGTLSSDDKKACALQMIKIQGQLNHLNVPKDQKFGYLNHLKDAKGLDSWNDVLWQHFNRSKQRIMDNGYFPVHYLERLEALLHERSEIFASIQAKPFFDDATTKNVLVNKGRISGIVDLDEICFGDYLYQIALTKMSLMSAGHDLEYVDYWIEALQLDNTAYDRLSHYILLFCVDFMSEMGMQFNKETIETPSSEAMNKLSELYEQSYHSVINRTYQLK